MTDHEHTPPTEAELDEREEYMRGVAANLPQVDWPRHALNAYAEVRRLRAERSADSERLDWLNAHPDGSVITMWGIGWRGWGSRRAVGPDTAHESIRHVIDAARQEPTP